MVCSTICLTVYRHLSGLLNGGWGFKVHTEGDLDQALKTALSNQNAFSFLDIYLEPTDISSALNRLAQRLSKVT